MKPSPTELKTPKTEGSERVVALDTDTTAALRAHRTRQKAERLAAGAGWTDTGLVFTNEDGAALHPATVTDLLHALTAAAGLPLVRLHDLRHGAATIALEWIATSCLVFPAYRRRGAGAAPAAP